MSWSIHRKNTVMNICAATPKFDGKATKFYFPIFDNRSTTSTLTGDCIRC